MALNPSDLIIDAGLAKIPVYDAANIILDAKKTGITLSGTVNKPCSIALFTPDGSLIDSVDVGAGSWLKEITETRVFLLSTDKGGKRWKAGVPLVVGDIVRPVKFSGFVYIVTAAGNSGLIEPNWWYPSVYVSGYIGTAMADVLEYSQPICHGIIGAL